MNRTLRGFFHVWILLAALVVCVGGEDDDSNSQSESETAAAAQPRIELASSPDAFLVYEDTYYFEIVAPASLSYTYKLRQAKDFGTNFIREYRHARLVIAEPLEACRPVVNNVQNAVVLVLRGGCSFLTKSNIIESAGAMAVIIADNDEHNDDHMVDMINDETGRKVSIPSMFLMGKDGLMIRRNLRIEGLDEAVINIPVNLTGVPIGKAKQPPWTLWS